MDRIPFREDDEDEDAPGYREVVECALWFVAGIVGAALAVLVSANVWRAN